MLTLEPPYYEISGISVFRDHAVDNQFYYAAPQPRLATADGRLMFDVMAYSVALEHSVLEGTQIPEEMGAGFLNMGIHCALDDSDRRRVIRGIEELTGIPGDEVALYPIPYHAGTVSLLALDGYHAPADPDASAETASPLQNRPTFVEEVLGTGRPNLGGDLRSIFSLRLSQEGLTFLQGLYEAGAAPVGVVYDLKYYGLRPVIEARVTADLSRIYTHFGGGLKAQKWIGADIQGGLEELETEGAVSVELTSGVVGEEAQRSREMAMSLFRDEIIQKMFHPVSPSAPVQTSTVSKAIKTLAEKTAPAAVGFTLNIKRQSELGTFTYDFRERSPGERIHAPQAFLPTLLTPAELRERIHTIPLQNSFFARLEVMVTGPTPEEFVSLRIRHVEAHISYGEKDDPHPPETTTLLFRPDSTGDKTFAFRRHNRRSLAYRCGLVYEFTEDGGTDADANRYELEPRRLTGRSLLINPYADFGVHNIEVQPGRIHRDVREIDVVLEYVSENEESEFSPREHFRLSVAEPRDPPAVRRWQIRTRHPEPGRYDASCSFVFHDGSVYQAPTTRHDTPLLLVDTPFAGDRQLLIQPNPISNQVDQITVEWVYDDPENGYRRQGSVELRAPFESVTRSWPLLDQDRQVVRYRVTVHEQGLVSQGEWQETTSPSIVVGDVHHRVIAVQLRLIGPALDEVGFDALMVQLRGINAPAPLDQPRYVFIESDTREATVEMMLPPGTSLHYRYQITTYRRDGTVAQSAWREETTPYLIIQTQNL